MELSNNIRKPHNQMSDEEKKALNAAWKLMLGTNSLLSLNQLHWTAVASLCIRMSQSQPTDRLNRRCLVALCRWPRAQKEDFICYIK